MTLAGTVFRVHSGNYHVATAEVGVVVCKLRGNLKKEFVYQTSGSLPRRVVSAKKHRRTDPISVGDRVRIDSENQVIEQIEPRTSELSRTSPSRRGQHTLVANLDQTLLVIAATDPIPDLWLLDRFIVMVEASGIGLQIVVNKIDLVGYDNEELSSLFETYTKIGYCVHYVSAREHVGIDLLRSAMEGKISAFAGPSGVGKSRLLNAIYPQANRKVGDISSLTHRGKHTTTNAELISLDESAASWIADTPGLAQLDFWDIPAQDIPLCFREFEAFSLDCRFSGCRHFDEPGCLVREATLTGGIDPRRYRSYRKIMSDLENGGNPSYNRNGIG